MKRAVFRAQCGKFSMFGGRLARWVSNYVKKNTVG